MPGNVPHTGDRIEYHQVPHGYVHPVEHHHWWWYAGILAGVLSCAAVSVFYWQLDQAKAPLCTRQIDSVLTSPNGAIDLELMHVSCLGGEMRQKLVLRKESGGNRTVISFDGPAKVRAKWISDDEIAVTQKGGKLSTFEPAWGGVHVRYR